MSGSSRNKSMLGKASLRLSADAATFSKLCVRSAWRYVLSASVIGDTKAKLDARMPIYE